MRKEKREMRALIIGIFLLFCAVFAFGQANIGIDGTVEWDKRELNAVVSLDLASAGLKLPNGRMQSEALIASEYVRLIRPGILHLQVDSSSNIADLLKRGEWSSSDIENIALQVRSVPPALSPDFSSLLASYTLNIDGIGAALIRHRRPAEIPMTLNPVSTPAYTGIIIIAAETLPIHGTKSSALIQPCLFPKIWDTEMKLIFERNMSNPGANTMVRYFTAQDIFTTSPSGLSPAMISVVGNRPLRIIARGLFGINPTDPIISHEDALQIISREENRNLLREGRIAIIIDDSMLKSPLRND
jgi:hypothetical protein